MCSADPNGRESRAIVVVQVSTKNVNFLAENYRENRPGAAFASIVADLVPLWAKVAVGGASVLAAVLAALQTFFKFAERAEHHKTFAAKFGAIRRELETLHASGRAAQEPSFVNVLREKLDRLAEEAPAVPSEVFDHIQKFYAT